MDTIGDGHMHTVRLWWESRNHRLHGPLLINVIQKSLLEHSIRIDGGLFRLLLGFRRVLLGIRWRGGLGSGFGLCGSLFGALLGSFCVC